MLLNCVSLLNFALTYSRQDVQGETGLGYDLSDVHTQKNYWQSTIWLWLSLFGYIAQGAETAEKNLCEMSAGETLKHKKGVNVGKKTASKPSEGQCHICGKTVHSGIE